MFQIHSIMFRCIGATLPSFYLPKPYFSLVFIDDQVHEQELSQIDRRTL